jgi:hypothetical protein
VSERAELRSARRAATVIQLPFNLADRQSLERELIGGAGVRMLGPAMSFLVGVQLARSLGPTGYGKYGTIMAVVSSRRIWLCPSWTPWHYCACLKLLQP